MEIKGGRRMGACELVPRHCERSEAIHLSAGALGAMDCFVAALLAMTTWQDTDSLIRLRALAQLRPLRSIVAADHLVAGALQPSDLVERARARFGVDHVARNDVAIE